jgi:Ca-activated chloride channel family protein
VIKWAEPGNLYFLLIVPFIIILLLFLYFIKRKAMRKFADPGLVAGLTSSFMPKLAVLKSALMILGLLFLIISLARPKWGEKLQIYEGKGIDIVVAMDASKSMLAQDIKPSRLERARSDVAYILDNIGTHQVGITAFAGDCHVMCPLTTDVDAAKLFLDLVDPYAMPRPGTNIEKAVSVSASLFNPKEDTYKALILFTDGDNLEGDPGAAVDMAASQGIRIFTVGVGSMEGAPVPEPAASGGVAYKKDRDGNIVMSRLAERLLLVIAKATNGRYFRTEGLYANRLIDELDRMKKKDIGGGEYVEFEERYQYFLVIAFAFMFLGVALSDRRGRWIQINRG